MKRRIYAIQNAYYDCIPIIMEEDEIKDRGIRLAIEGYQEELDAYMDDDKDIPVNLAVKYVQKLSEHVGLLVSDVQNDPRPQTNSPKFYRLAEPFLQQYQTIYESKYSSEISSSPFAFDQVEHKHAPRSSTQERMSPRPKDGEDKYEQKREPRPKPEIKPVVVNEELRAAGNKFREQIRTKSGDGIAELLIKHGFLSDSKDPAKAMAHQLLTEGYKRAPRPKLKLFNQKRPRIKASKGDFKLAIELQDEEIGRFFEP